MTDSTNAHDLPDGTQVEHDGTVYTAFPETELAGRLIRWHSDFTVATDRAMDEKLDNGAKVIGRDEEALAEFQGIMSGRG